MKLALESSDEELTAVGPALRARILRMHNVRRQLRCCDLVAFHSDDAEIAIQSRYLHPFATMTQLPMIATVMTRAFVWTSLFVGTVARALPLFDFHGRALRQFASEDGYLMLTIARNLAIGNGLSVEDGTTLTNGTQPLLTFVYAGLFWLVGGDKVWGVVLAQVLGIAIGLLGALLLYRIGLRLLAGDQEAAALAATAAAAWYVAPVGARYTQNCLETGAATLLPMAIGLFFLRRAPGPEKVWPLARCAVLGALLGVAFWVRNDAVLLAGAVCLSLMLSGSWRRSATAGRRIIEAGCVGTTALLIASPWLIFNQTSFGHVVPVSGISQGANVPLGHNLAFLGSILAEQISIVALIPRSWETVPIVLVLTWAMVVAWSAGVYWQAKDAGGVQRQWLAILSVWAVLVIGFYGAIYGAGYFMGRYLFPLSPWMALLSVALAQRLWARAGSPRPRVAQAMAFSFILLMALGLDVRAHLRGMNNGHFQVVEWVDEHVPEHVWVGAIQTGTVGFFHDRTYNLDGKVSPPALQARAEGRILEYVLERPTQYLVDWVGIATWVDDERLAPHFEVVLADERRNLAVLRRTTPIESSRSVSPVDSPGSASDLASGEALAAGRNLPAGSREFFASRSSCMAPCGVRFDAQVTEDLKWAEVRDQRFVWDFGDRGAGSEGFLAAHMFESPGVYNVSLTVDGTAWASMAVTVSAPSRTVCVSPTSSFGECPSAARADHFTTIGAAFGSVGSGSHVLLHRGESHGALPGNGAAGRTGSYLLGAYGSGAKPKVTSDNGRPRGGWTFQDLDVSTVGADSYNFTSDATDHVVFHRIDSTDGARRFVSMFSEGPSNWMFFENTLVKGEYVMFACCTGLVIKGNSITRTGTYGGPQHAIRIAGTDHALVQDNVFDAQAPHTSLALRGGEPVRNGSNWVLVQGNTFDKHTMCGPQNDTSSGIQQHIVWEENRYNLDTVGGCTSCSAGRFTGHDLVVRNNIIGGEMTGGLYVREHPLVQNQRIQFINNTVVK